MAIGVAIILASVHVGALLSAAPTPCPSTVTGFVIATKAPVTADLVSAQQAEVLNGVHSYDGLLATYQLEGGYTIEQVVIPGLGGLVGDTFGLLSDYHYNADGSCTYYAPPTTTTSTTSSGSTATTTSTPTSTSTATSSSTSTSASTTSAPRPDYGLALLGSLVLASGAVLAVRGRPSR